MNKWNKFNDEEHIEVMESIKDFNFLELTEYDYYDFIKTIIESDEKYTDTLYIDKIQSAIFNGKPIIHIEFTVKKKYRPESNFTMDLNAFEAIASSFGVGKTSLAWTRFMRAKFGQIYVDALNNYVLSKTNGAGVEIF